MQQSSFAINFVAYLWAYLIDFVENKLDSLITVFELTYFGKIRCCFTWFNINFVVRSLLRLTELVVSGVYMKVEILQVDWKFAFKNAKKKLFNYLLFTII